MSIDSTHPLYDRQINNWKMCRDSYAGEDVIKEKGQTYLPATSGQEEANINVPNSRGYQEYSRYKARAVFHEYLKEAVETAIGVMWQKPPVIELPAALEKMRENATTSGEGLLQLLRRINEEQLVTGRLGLLLDFPTTPQPIGSTPYIAFYVAENIINWDDGLRGETVQDSLNLVVLDESEPVRKEDFQWEEEEKYRVLLIGETLANEESGTYRAGVFTDNLSFSEEKMKTPSISGGEPDSIPFVFINSKDIVASTDIPPLLGVARASLAIYRGEADYRQALHLQSQDTLVLKGAPEGFDAVVGAGTALVIPSDADAKYIGVSSQGLPEQRQALENDKNKIAGKSGQLLDASSKQKESGEALNTRIKAQTATLNQIALAGAGGLEKILKKAAEWVNASPDEVKVIPNLDFASDKLLPDDLLKMQSAKTMGAPISEKTIHNNMQKKGLTELTYEEEQDEIEQEAPTGLDIEAETENV